MARVISMADDSKRHTKTGKTVRATVGMVVDGEYYEISVTASEETGKINVSKFSSKDSKPKDVYHVPAKPKVRKKTSPQSSGKENPEQQENLF